MSRLARRSRSYGATVAHALIVSAHAVANAASVIARCIEERSVFLLFKVRTSPLPSVARLRLKTRHVPTRIACCTVVRSLSCLHLYHVVRTFAAALSVLARCVRQQANPAASNA